MYLLDFTIFFLMFFLEKKMKAHEISLENTELNEIQKYDFKIDLTPLWDACLVFLSDRVNRSPAELWPNAKRSGGALQSII